MPRLGRTYPIRPRRQVFQPIAFDAVGSGGQAANGFTTSLATTWTHTAKGAVVAGFGTRIAGQNNVTYTRTVTYGGVTMLPLVTNPLGVGSDMAIDLFGLLNPPSGSQTVSVTVSGGANTGITMIGTSVSYTGVGGFGGSAVANATSTTPAVTLPSQYGEWGVYGLAAYNVNQSTFAQNNRFAVLSSDFLVDCLIGDSPGINPSIPFSGTQGGSNAWANAAVRLLPKPVYL